MKTPQTVLLQNEIVRLHDIIDNLERTINAFKATQTSQKPDQTTKSYITRSKPINTGDPQ